jgi:hypothetical protein
MLAVVLAALALGTIGIRSIPPAAARPPSRTARADSNLTPVIESVISTPRWYKADDGLFHLEYELQLTNAAGVPVEASSVQVLDPAGRSIAKLSGERLKAAMSLISSPDQPTTTLPAAAVGIVWFDLSFPTRRAIPNEIEHRLTVDIGPALPELGPLITDTGAQTRVAAHGPAVLAPPLLGGRWVPVIGAHRRSLFPVNGQLRDGQRFAVDFSARLDSGGRTHHGDVHLNSSYFNFAQPVLAVGAGRVVSVVDRFPDQTPLQPTPTTLAEADGNHVIIRLRKGVFAAYAHIKPGSIRVHQGQRVQTGQMLGLLGNSGNTSGPHLHFQLMDRPSFLDADGLPFVLERFHLDGRIPSLEAFISADADPAAPPVPYQPSKRGARRLQGLTGLELISFPTG